MRPTRARLLAIPAVALLALTANARLGLSAPADKAFTVANYPVDATAKDAVTAKEKAHADGQQAAFRSLLKRLVPVTAYNRLKRLGTVKAANLVDGVAVRQESNSTTRYIASLDFSFQPQAVRDLLRREGIPFIETQASRIVLVPLARDARTGAVRADPAWSGVWSSLDLEHPLTPLKLEPLRPVIHQDTVKQLLEGDFSAERVLLSEYKAERIVLAVVEPDPATKRLNVTLAGHDAVGPILWKRAYRLQGEDIGYTQELAAVVGLGVLEGRWKAVQAGARGGVEAIAGPGDMISMIVEFNSMQQWNEVRSQLLETPGIDDVRVGSISARSAEIALRYPGGTSALTNELAARGLTLRNSGGMWLLRQSF